MRFKEIKQGVMIHCKTEEEAKRLCEHLDSLGFTWNGGDKLTKTNWEIYREETCYCPYKNVISCTMYSHYDNSEITEFSDLIIPEMSAEKVLRIRNELSYDFVREYLGLCHGYSLDGMLRKATIEQVIDMCEQWKADHEKKEPEIETEWYRQGIIYKVLGDGRISRLMDGEGIYDTGCECKESAEEYMADKLKEFCKTHEGEYIATVERVCRIKRKE